MSLVLAFSLALPTSLVFVEETSDTEPSAEAVENTTSNEETPTEEETSTEDGEDVSLPEQVLQLIQSIIPTENESADIDTLDALEQDVQSATSVQAPQAAPISQLAASENTIQPLADPQYVWYVVYWNFLNLSVDEALANGNPESIVRERGLFDCAHYD